MALYEASHVRDIILGHIPFPEYLVGDTGKVVIRILKRNFGLVWCCADLERLPPYCPIRIGVFIAVCDVAEVVDSWVKVPVAGNIIKRVVFQGQVDYMLDLFG